GTTSMELNRSAGTNDVLRGASSIAFGGTLSLTNLAGQLANGDAFKLFYAGSLSGGFTNLVPPMPASGLAWDVHTLTDDGTLRIVVAPRPVINSSLNSGGDLVLNGTNGIANAPYYVLSGSNLALPVAQWTRIATNLFDSFGNFGLTITNNGAPQSFFVLQ